MSNDDNDQAMKKRLDDVMKIADQLVERAVEKLPSAGVEQLKDEALRIYKNFLASTETPEAQEHTKAVILAIGIAAKKVATNRKEEVAMSDKCNRCGAEIEYSAGSQSLKCPYCGAANEIKKAEDQLPKIVGKIIPLTVSQDDLEKRVYGYMVGGNYTPDDMLEASTFTKRELLYVPAYLFKVSYEATWTASFGYDRTEHYTEYETQSLGTDSHGHSRGTRQVPVTKTKTVTDWRPANGVDSGSITVSTYAGKTLGESGLAPADLVPYAISNGSVTDFNPSFMKGFEAENFKIPEKVAFDSLDSEMTAKIGQKVKNHGQGDHQKDWHWKASMSHVAWTLYVPICHAVFDYQGAEYHVWIDGIGQGGLRADKLPEDKGRKKSVYLGFVPLGVGIAASILVYLMGTFTFDCLIVTALFGGGYAAMRRWNIIKYSKTIRDSLLTQIQASSNSIKAMGSEEQDKVARAFQRPEKPFLAKTHLDKFVLPSLSVLVLMLVLGSAKHLEKAPQAVTENMVAPAAIAAPALALSFVVQPDTVSSVPAVMEAASSPLVSSAVNNSDERTALCNSLNLDVAAEQAECLNRQLSSVDKQLNDVYKQLAAGLDDTSKRSLKTEQIAWIKEKESKCTQAGKEVEGGSLESVVIADCMVQMTDQRIVYLKNYK